MSRPCALCLLVTLGLVACAVPPEPQNAPASQQPSSSYGQPGYGQPGYGQPGYPQPGFGSQPTAPPPGTTPPPPSGSVLVLPIPPRNSQPQTLTEALRELDSEASRLQTSLSSCELACKSLGSMERAVRVVCELARDEERPRCEEARRRLRDARARVRGACGECAGGPRTDASAPDP